MQDISPIGVFVSSFMVAAFAGMAAILRSGVKLSVLIIITAVMNSGLLGLGISLLWYTKFQENLYFLIGVCLLAGLGGMTTVDFALQALRRGGFSVRIGKDSSVELPDEGKK